MATTGPTILLATMLTLIASGTKSENMFPVVGSTLAEPAILADSVFNRVGPGGIVDPRSDAPSKLGKEPIKLGSTTDDQVFVPAAPCRIVDTRIAGGPIAAGETRNYQFYSSSPNGTFSPQGGTAGPLGATCPQTVNPNNAPPSAAVVTITVVGPSAAGNFVVWGGAPYPTLVAR